MNQISNNQNILRRRVMKIEKSFNDNVHSVENLLIVCDTVNQQINIYQLILHFLTVVENSLTFAKLGVMHPSIIKPSKLYEHLSLMQNKIGEENLPLPVSLENIPIYESIIQIQAYISNTTIVFIIKIPITYSNKFDYYHLYAIPIFNKDFIIPLITKPYLLINNTNVAQMFESCPQLDKLTFFCETHLFTGEKSCGYDLLKNVYPNNCEWIPIKIRNYKVLQLEETNYWIVIAPEETSIAISCPSQEIQQKIKGTYVFKAQMECTLTTNGETLITGITEDEDLPIPLFIEFNTTLIKKNPIAPIQLREVNLGTSQEIIDILKHNNPNIKEDEASYHNYLIYACIFTTLIIIVYVRYRKAITKGWTARTRSSQISAETSPCNLILTGEELRRPLPV